MLCSARASRNWSISNAEIAELRRELLAHRDASVAQIKTVFETEVATLQRQLAEARAELSKLQMLDASQSGDDTTRSDRWKRQPGR